VPQALPQNFNFEVVHASAVTNGGTTNNYTTLLAPDSEIKQVNSKFLIILFDVSVLIIFYFQVKTVEELMTAIEEYDMERISKIISEMEAPDVFQVINYEIGVDYKSNPIRFASAERSFELLSCLIKPFKVTEKQQVLSII
jgi:hypothetical protein